MALNTKKVLNDLDVTNGLLLNGSAGSSGQALISQGSGAAPTWGTVSGGGGGAFTFSGTAPSSPSAGDRWMDSASGITYTYFNDGNTNQWVEMGVSALLPAAISQSSLTKTITSTASTSISTAATDAGTFIQTTSSSAIAISITNTLSAGQFIDFVQYGTGQITFSAGSGVTLVSSGTKLKTSAQYATASVQCLSAGVYLLFGDLSV
jgi:hypothetical protein